MPELLPTALVYEASSNPPFPFEGGILLIDKPAGWTSFDVVAKLRGILRVRKIGHAGTLDPMATGLLVCCVGAATKQVALLTGLEKHYEGRLRLGERTASYDRDTPVEEVRPWNDVTFERIEAAMHSFEGEIDQLPPMYSAIKVGGRRLYQAARKGEVLERTSRRVRVRAFRPTGKEGPEVDFAVTCSKGTYVRSLAHDLGELLGCGAHLTGLRRTRVGPYSVAAAWSLDALSQYFTAQRQASAHFD